MELPDPLMPGHTCEWMTSLYRSSENGNRMTPSLRLYASQDFYDYVNMMQIQSEEEVQSGQMRWVGFEENNHLGNENVANNNILLTDVGYAMTCIIKFLKNFYSIHNEDCPVNT